MDILAEPSKRSFIAPVPPVGISFPAILWGLLMVELGKKVRDFVQNDLPELARKKQEELTKQLSTIKQGEDFLSLKVILATTKTVTLLFGCADQEVKYPVWEDGKPGTKTVPGLKINLARAAFEIERSYFNITHSDQPIVHFVGGSEKDALRESTIEISWQRDSYKITLGGGKSSIPGFEQEQYLVEVYWKSPAFRFRGYWAGSSRGGFILELSAPLPVPIPLASTGLALCGLGFQYGERFAPQLTEYVPNDPVAEMRIASATKYIEWSQKHDLNKWLPVPQDLRIFGISADIGDLGTSGKIVGIYNAGVTYLSYGPTILWGGRLRVLESGDLVEVRGAIDLPSKSVAVVESLHFDVIPDGWLSIDGRIELSGSLIDPTKTYIALGGYDMGGCRVKVLKGALELWGGYRLAPLQGAAIRAGGKVEGSGELLGIGGDYSFSIEVTARLGWNPGELGGQLDVGGSVHIKIWKLTLGAGVAAKLVLQLAKPLELSLSGEVSVDLPWPLGTQRFGFTIFHFSDPEVAPPQPALALIAGEHLKYIHHCSGTLGQLDDKPWPEVWPDISFDIPFRSLPGSPSNVVNNSKGDGSSNEGGIQVTHSMSRLEIAKVDPKTLADTGLTDVSAAWLGMGVAGKTERTSRLAIPCNDPLAWLQTFEYAQPGTAQSYHRTVFQPFGDGPDQILAEFDLGELRISGKFEFHLARLHWIEPYARAILGRWLVLEVAAQGEAGRTPLAVASFEVRLVARNEPDLRVDVGTVDLKKVRHLGDGMWEWSAVVLRDKADALAPLRIEGGETEVPIVAIGYTIDTSADISGGTEKVLEPGLYRLYINGTSETKNHPVGWSAVQPFKVVPPPQLRPYLRYATFGDERVFGVAHGGWNPNPHGVGFGHYNRHRGAIRSKVGYLSKIYPKLWISPTKDDPAVAVDVKQCTDLVVAGSRLSQEWRTISGAASSFEEELIFDLPKTPGSYFVKVFRSEKGDGSGLVPIDEWPYRVSQYALPQDHLKPKTNALSRAYGPFGVRIFLSNLRPIRRRG